MLNNTFGGKNTSTKKLDQNNKSAYSTLIQLVNLGNNFKDLHSMTLEELENAFNNAFRFLKKDVPNDKKIVQNHFVPNNNNDKKVMLPMCSACDGVNSCDRKNQNLYHKRVIQNHFVPNNNDKKPRLQNCTICNGVNSCDRKNQNLYHKKVISASQPHPHPHSHAHSPLPKERPRVPVEHISSKMLCFKCTHHMQCDKTDSRFMHA